MQIQSNLRVCFGESRIQRFFNIYIKSFNLGTILNSILEFKLTQPLMTKQQLRPIT